MNIQSTDKNRNRHSVVLGAGAGGLAMALLLAEAGRRVTLLELQPRIGGYLRRFERGGIPFDTGFHFTGGFDGVFGQMLRMLNMDDLVREELFGSRIFFGDSGRSLVLPKGGYGELAAYLKSEFPADRAAIDEYYRAEKFVVDHTPMFDLGDPDMADKLALNEYDFMTLDEFLDRLRVSGELRAALGSAAMCHGTPPAEASVTHHARVSFGLGDHIARAGRGGDSLLDGFAREAKRLGIDVRTGVTVAECAMPGANRECHRVRLTDGDELEFDDMFLAIHPRAILKLLPESRKNALFRERVANLQDTCGFFSIFGTVEGVPDAASELTSYLSEADLNAILLPEGRGTGTGIVTARETDAAGRPVVTLTAFRTAFPQATARWSGLSRAEREADPGYREFKARQRAEIEQEVGRAYPEYRGKLRLVTDSSWLTCRDYVPPSGCAYGVRQKVGEPRLFGRLPVRNFYALGHGALIPGVLGTWMASFLLFRQVAGESAYWDLYRRRLG